MKNPQRFYTYAYLRLDGTPYYIGKGQRDRAYSKNHINIFVPPKERILFLKKNLLEEEAFNHEKYMISVFGRRDLGTGVLHNRTEGGEGSANISDATKEKMRQKKVGKSLSLSHIKKLSEIRKGNIRWNNGIIEKLCKEYPGEGWIRGRLITDETKLKYGKCNIGRKSSPETLEKISIGNRKYEYTIESPTGEIFITDNMSKFCKKNNLTARLMISVAHGKYKHHKGWKIVTVQKLSPLPQKSLNIEV
jgi:hypothetical protein